MATTCSMIYRPLERPTKQIRLLEIISIEPQVVFKIHTASLLDKPDFSALSYVWGYPPLFADVIVDGAALPVTQSLIDAVKDVHNHWRQKISESSSRQLRLWADAICINQEDVVEKNFQVPLMREIYSGAEQVLSWLGKSDEATSAALDALQLIYKEIADLDEDSLRNLDWMKKHQQLCTGYPGDPRGPWLGIINLMHRQYWNRVWIFQEVYLAQDLLLISGSNVLSFAQLRSIQNWHDVAILDRQSPPSCFAPSTWAYLQAHRSMFESISAIEQARDIIHDGEAHQRKIRHILKGTISDETIVFYNQVETHALLLWMMAGVLESTDPRDSIYALMGISGLAIEPDYTPEKSVAEVYMAFLALWEHCCSQLHPHYPDNVKSGILDLWFLTFAGVESHTRVRPSLGLPSWAPNFPATSLRTESGWSYSSSAMNQFSVGDELFNGIDEKWHIDRHSLYCPTVKIDRVRSCGPVIDVLNEELVSWILGCLTQQTEYPTGFHSAIAMQRALVDEYLDEDMDHIVLPTLIEAYEFACLFMIWDRHFGKGSNDREAAANRLAPLVWSLLLGLDREDDYATFWERLPGWVGRISAEELDSLPATISLLDIKRIIAACDNLELALSTSGGDIIAQTEKGYIGRFPLYTREGDLICLFKGYDGPVVVREIEEHHVFVGSSFIIEPLGGRSITEMEKLKADIQVIEVR
ncbi:hypothetical protein VPNG_02207 [Cytospora leucostoma]|uniref:Heterokaryon incompatibility domain-containing protein n=1 Tax=Cytospora leucostoma TaxID=1230097 RepID=A0A423XH39_9PEZI|nr:hypothetical protein VPNG_02207 [Cytospora leucostoma]